MKTLHADLQDGAIGLTVYSPDCAQSRLWGNLDHAIAQATAFSPIYRRWIHHDYNSVMRFYAEGDGEIPQTDDPEAAARKYDRIPAETLQYGHLVVKLLLAGPSLLTIWRGDDAVKRLLALKGKTHPALAGSGEIRRRFWNDNAVCNLIHSSDSIDDVAREFQVLGLSDVLDIQSGKKPLTLLEPIPLPDRYVSHSGIVVMYDVIRRMLATQGAILPAPVSLPASGDAHATNRLFSAALADIADIKDAIAAFLKGDIVQLMAHLPTMPVTSWERFVILCGAINRDEWQ